MVSTTLSGISKNFFGSSPTSQILQELRFCPAEDMTVFEAAVAEQVAEQPAQIDIVGLLVWEKGVVRLHVLAELFWKVFEPTVIFC